MWAASSSSPSPSFRRRRLTIPTRPPPCVPISAKSHPPKTDAQNTTPNNSISIKSIIAHKILSPVNSPNTNPNPNQTTPKQAAPQISGSDVLRALQKAAAMKEKSTMIRQVKENKKESSTDGTDSEINHGARPLRIKTDWAFRLTQLEKRLQEMSDTV